MKKTGGKNVLFIVSLIFLFLISSDVHWITDIQILLYNYSTPLLQYVRRIF